MRIAIIGSGLVGSELLVTLLKRSPSDQYTIYDDDIVTTLIDGHCILNRRNSGLNKLDCLHEYIQLTNPEVSDQVKYINQKIRRLSETDFDYVYDCRDFKCPKLGHCRISVDGNRFIYETVDNNSHYDLIYTKTNYEAGRFIEIYLLRKYLNMLCDRVMNYSNLKQGYYFFIKEEIFEIDIQNEPLNFNNRIIFNHSNAFSDLEKSEKKKKIRIYYFNQNNILNIDYEGNSQFELFELIENNIHWIDNYSPWSLFLLRIPEKNFDYSAMIVPMPSSA